MIIKTKNHVFYIAIIVIAILLGSIIQLNKINQKQKINRKIPSLTEQSSYSEYLTGYYLLKNQDIEKASSYLLKSYTASDNEKILQDYFITLLLSGNVGQAIELIEADNKNIILSDLLLAIKEIKYNQYEKALSILNNIKTIQTDNLVVPMMKIWCEIGIKNYKKSKLKFNQLDVASEKYNIAKFQLALAMNYIGNIKEAEEEFDELFIDTQPIHYGEIGQKFYRKIGKTEKAELLKKKYQIKNYDSDQSLNNFSYSPSEALSIFLSDISLILFNSRFSSQSFIYSQLAYYLNNESDQNNFILANQYLDIKNYDKAIEYFSKINNKSSRYILAKINIANCLYKLNQKDNAKNTVKEVLYNNPSSIEAVLLLGEFYQSEKDYSSAIDVYNNIINNNIDNSKNYWSVYYMRASLHQLNQNSAQAESDYLKALELSPDNPAILNDLAYNWIEENKNLSEALDMINKALLISPENPQFIDTIGWLMFKSGKFDEALSYLDKATQLIPYDSTINNHLGDVYWKIGKKNNARFEWQHAYDNSQDENEKNKIILKIKNGI